MNDIFADVETPSALVARDMEGLRQNLIAAEAKIQPFIFADARLWALHSRIVALESLALNAEVAAMSGPAAFDAGAIGSVADIMAQAQAELTRAIAREARVANRSNGVTAATQVDDDDDGVDADASADPVAQAALTDQRPGFFDFLRGKKAAANEILNTPTGAAEDAPEQTADVDAAAQFNAAGRDVTIAPVREAATPASFAAMLAASEIFVRPARTASLDNIAEMLAASQVVVRRALPKLDDDFRSSYSGMNPQALMLENVSVN